MDFIKLNVHACAGGWCTRERQHRRWRNGQPWASGSSGWWTFLRRRWARGRLLVEMLFRSSQKMEFRKLFPQSWRNHKRALALKSITCASRMWLDMFRPATNSITDDHKDTTLSSYNNVVASECRSITFCQKRALHTSILCSVKALSFRQASA